MKNCLTPLVIREMQINTDILSYYLEWLLSRTQNITNDSKDVGVKRNPSTLLVGM